MCRNSTKCVRVFIFIHLDIDEPRFLIWYLMIVDFSFYDENVFIISLCKFMVKLINDTVVFSVLGDARSIIQGR